MTRKEQPLIRNNDKPAEDQLWFDGVCTCNKCDHGLVRDCLKIKCTCCKGHDYSMVLDGIEGFPPTGK